MIWYVRSEQIKKLEITCIMGNKKSQNSTKSTESGSKCPFHNGASKKSAVGSTQNLEWWPNRLNLDVLRQHTSESSPMDEDFDYTDEFKKLDLDAVIAVRRFDFVGITMDAAIVATIKMLSSIPS